MLRGIWEIHFPEKMLLGTCLVTPKLFLKQGELSSWDTFSLQAELMCCSAPLCVLVSLAGACAEQRSPVPFWHEQVRQEISEQPHLL